MRILVVALSMFCCVGARAQQPPALPHGMIYGSKPDTALALPVANLEKFMGRKVRLALSLKGKVVKVTKQHGGWFLLNAGQGKIIEAHFKDYNVNLPTQLAGRIVLLEGIAARQFKADPLQHYAGEGLNKKPKTQQRRPRIEFEVKGLMIYQ